MWLPGITGMELTRNGMGGGMQESNTHLSTGTGTLEHGESRHFLLLPES